MTSDDDKPVSPTAQTVDATAAQDPLVGTTLAHYRIVGRLGAGGMGVVYRAEDEKLRRAVAIKVLPDASGNEERRQRFLREARSAAAITHPNVAVVYQVDEADGRIYIAMEASFEGENLRARLERGRLDVAMAKDFAVQIARGLAAAHEKEIVHRDLKPENVMITPAGVVKLLDFGLAKVGVDKPASGKTEAALAKTETVVTSDEGRIMGTPEYMSPEQALGQPLDVRSDVFSLGIVLYEMFSGTRPFGGTTTGAILVAIARDAAPPLREKAPEVDEATEVVVMKCLAKGPGERFANARGVVAALSRPLPSRQSGGSEGALLPPTPAAAPPKSQSHVIARLAVVGALVAMLLVARSWTAKRAPETPLATPSASIVASGEPSGRPYPERRLTAYPAEDYIKDAALTPDGVSLVFSDNDGFWVQPVGGGTRRSLAIPLAKGDIANTVAMFRDGTQVVASALHGTSTVSWVATLDGGPPRSLRDGAGGARPSPDGTQLVVCRDSGAVEVASFEGGPWTKITTALAQDCDVHWAPDSRHVLTYDGAALIVAAVDGGSTRALYKDDLLNMEGVRSFDWPERHRVVFARRAREAGWCVVDEIAVDDDGRATAPPWELWRTRASTLRVSAAGVRLAVIPGVEQQDVYVARLDVGAHRLDGASERLSMSDAKDCFAQWLPDGRVAYYSERDQTDAIYAQAPGSAAAQVLVEPPVARSWFQPLTSGEIVYSRPANVDADARLTRTVISRDGRDERELFRAKRKTQTIRCGGGSPSHCVLLSMLEGEWTLSRFDLESGRAGSPFYRGTLDVQGWEVSPDGATVVATANSGTLTSIRVADGTSRTFSTTPSARFLQGVDFVPGGHGLIVAGIQFTETPYGIAHIDLDGRGEMLLSSTGLLRKPVVSPDGRWLAFDKDVYDTDVWLLEPP